MTQKKVKKEKKKIKSGMRSRSIQGSLPRPKPIKNKVLKNLTRQISRKSMNFKKYEKECKELMKKYIKKGYQLWFVDEMNKPGGWTDKCHQGDINSCNQCQKILNDEELTDISRQLVLKQKQKIREEKKQIREKKQVRNKPPKQNTLSDLRYELIDKQIRSKAKTKKRPKKSKTRKTKRKTKKRIQSSMSSQMIKDIDKIYVIVDWSNLCHSQGKFKNMNWNNSNDQNKIISLLDKIRTTIVNKMNQSNLSKDEKTTTKIQQLSKKIEIQLILPYSGGNLPDFAKINSSNNFNPFPNNLKEYMKKDGGVKFLWSGKFTMNDKLNPRSYSNRPNLMPDQYAKIIEKRCPGYRPDYLKDPSPLHMCGSPDDILLLYRAANPSPDESLKSMVFIVTDDSFHSENNFFIHCMNQDNKKIQESYSYNDIISKCGAGKGDIQWDVGIMCEAQYKDGNWYEAEIIEKMSKGKWKVHYIDYNESEIKNNRSLRMIQPLYPKILKNWEWTDINTKIKVPLYKILREFTGNPNVRRCLVDIQNKLKNKKKTKNIKDSLCRNMSQKISSKSITNQL